MKTLKFIARLPQLLLMCFALMLAAVIDTWYRRTWCLYEGPPSDLKSLHEAMEKAFDAMKENVKKVQDTASKALEEVRQEGTLHAKTNEKLTELGTTGNKLSSDLAELKARTLEVEQKLVKRPGGGGGEDPAKSIGQIVAESEQFKHAASLGAKSRGMDPVDVGSFHKTAIVNATINNDQPLVAPLRLPGIIQPALRRLTIRDLLPQTPISSNIVEFARELVYTNNAGPQYDASPGSTEAALKNESGITFELANAPVITFAHWIPASRQVLSDAPLLQGYVDGRLRYGLALAEEAALLTGDGTAGTLNGLNNNATAFTYGSTNQTALDTLLKAQLQVSLSYYEVTGYVLHPVDWVGILLLKDTQGRYLFSDPHGMEAPRVWGKDVVPTQAQTQGQFLAGAFALAAEIFDRDGATVRVAEQHADFFVRNMVAILAEERLALAIYRTASFVKGAITTPG
jgi:HK97 family phage major capsid protein